MITLEIIRTVALMCAMEMSPVLTKRCFTETLQCVKDRQQRSESVEAITLGCINEYIEKIDMT